MSQLRVARRERPLGDEPLRRAIGRPARAHVLRFYDLKQTTDRLAGERP